MARMIRMSNKDAEITSKVHEERLVTEKSTPLSVGYYKEYAGYVNKTRALASPVDGMKHVYRRMLYTAASQPKDKLMKSAVIVGDAAKLHPHGEQPAVLYNLVTSGMGMFDKQGNFGSNVNAGSAPRYTGCNLNEVGRAYLGGDLIDYCEMVEGDIGYMEPKYLPTLIPYVLTEGNDAMGVGVSSSVYKLNIKDLIDYYRSYLKGEKSKNVRVDYGSVHILDDETEVSRAVESGEVTRLESVCRVFREGNTVRVKDIPHRAALSKIMKRVQKYIDEDIVDYRDESKEERLLAFEVVDTKKLKVDELATMIENSSRTRNSYANVFSYADKIYYLNLAQVRELGINYLKECTIKKYTTIRDKAIKDIRIYEVISAMKIRGIVGQLFNLTQEDIIAKLSDHAPEDVKAALSKSISSLLRSVTEVEYKRLKATIEEADEILKDQSKYLIALYDKFESLLDYESNTTYASSLTTESEDKVDENRNVNLQIGITSTGWAVVREDAAYNSEFISADDYVPDKDYAIITDEGEGIILNSNVLKVDVGVRVISSNSVTKIIMLDKLEDSLVADIESFRYHEGQRARKPKLII